MAGIPIERLDLSVRAHNILRGMSICSVEQLLNTPIDRIAGQRNAGAKTVQEISDVVDGIRKGETDLNTIATTYSVLEKDKYFAEDQLEELARHEITELNIPSRVNRFLMNNQCDTIDKVVTMSWDDMRNAKGLGRRSAEELRSALEHWFLDHRFLVGNSEDDIGGITSEEKEYFQRLAQTLKPVAPMYWRQLRYLIWASELSMDVVNIDALLDLPELRPYLEKLFLKMIPEAITEVERLREKLKELPLEFDHQLLFDKLCDGTVCSMEDGYCMVNRDHFLQYVWSHCGDRTIRNNDILIRRIQGDSLQSVGDECGLTRERVRQILIKTVSSFPALYEDFFREPYEYFKFAKEDFCAAFPMCGEAGYEYLFIRYAKGKTILSSETVSKYHGLFAERLSDYLKERSLKQEKDSATRTDMTYRVLIGNSDQALSLTEFEAKYYEYLDQKGYSKDRLKLNMRSVTNHLRNAKHIVFDKNNCVRFCDADPEKVWNTVDFRRYKDHVISAELIFRDYKDLMKELDIRDGYELFYLIKSSLAYWDQAEFQIICRRIPVLVLGDGNEERQALQLLKEISPIGYSEYYEAYEERYGLRRDTVQGNSNVNKALSKYYSLGKYAIDVPAIDERDAALFKAVLSSSTIWFMEDLEREFSNVCVHSSMDALNTAAFKRIGYSLNVGYAYHDSYQTVTNYFDEEVFSGNLVNLSALDRRIINLPAFTSALDRKRKNLDYIEIAPKVLMSISEVKEQYNIDRNEIEAIQEWVMASCNDKYFNAHSLWHQLPHNSIMEKLQNNQWMCTCIFRQQEAIFSLVVAGGIILSKDSNELSLSKVCEWLVAKNGKMEIKRLTDLFNETFGTRIPYYKMAEKLRSFGVWDQVVTDSFEDYLDLRVKRADINVAEDDFT